jgi:hypothetical protein
MSDAGKLDRKHWLLGLSMLLVGLLGLSISGCDSSSSSVPPPFAITAVYPPDNSEGALVTSRVTVTFRDEMNAATIDDSTFILTLGGTPVAVSSVVYDPTSKTATLTPAADLELGEEYRATVKATVENSSGVTPLVSDYSWEFIVCQSVCLASENDSGTVGNNNSAVSDINMSGRYIVFESNATNLTRTATTNLRNHIYRKDTVTGEVQLVSSTTNGIEADNHSASPGISGDGCLVVFESVARNLDTTAGNNIGFPQIYLKDMCSEPKTTRMISRNSTDASNNSGSRNADISSNGRFIVFESNANNLVPVSYFIPNNQIYLVDLNSGVTELISIDPDGNETTTGNSTNPAVNDDGRFIAFDSYAFDLVAVDTNGTADVFVRDRGDPVGTDAKTILVSSNTSGIDTANAPSQHPNISGNGNFVVFESFANNLTTDQSPYKDIYLRDITLETTSLVNVIDTTPIYADNESSNATISSDGRFIVFESKSTNLDGGTFSKANIFIRDMLTSDAIKRISLKSDVDSNNPAISSNGRYVSFDSNYSFTVDDTNNYLSDVFRAYNSTYQ